MEQFAYLVEKMDSVKESESGDLACRCQKNSRAWKIGKVVALTRCLCKSCEAGPRPETNKIDRFPM